MADLINDGSLVLFSPLNDPSGSPVFINYAPGYLNKDPSHHWHVQIANGFTTDPGGLWPGTDSESNHASGNLIRGYRVQGTADYNQGFGPGTKCLVYGMGGDSTKDRMAPGDVAQSGFTLGFWVYPTSDGAWGRTGFASSNEVNAERHTLLGRANATAGMCFGISGLLSKAAQFNTPGNQDGLSAFLHIKGGATHLTTPIESGRYTHLAMTYRFVNGTVNQYVLYKDGRVAASGTSSVELGSANAGYGPRPLAIGGSQDTSNLTNQCEFTTGWNNLVSGVYGFDRVLHEGEVLELHERGGLQVGTSAASRPLATSIQITDPTLQLYLPMQSPGLIDASKYHHNCFSIFDDGVVGNLIIAPGPFGRTIAFKDDSGTVDVGIATPSGVIQNILAGNGSFSIGGHFMIVGSQTAFDQNELISIGSIGTADLTPARQTAGLHISTSGSSGAHRIIARVHDIGYQVPIPIFTSDTNMWAGINRHVAFVYDGQTQGAALYVDGMLAGSGTLPNQFKDVITRLAGSGYPFVFNNGVVSETVDSFDNSAGDDCGVGEAFIFSRPLKPDEIRYLAQSGIDIAPTHYTAHDTRLRGYWKGTEQITNDLMFPDYALCFAGAAIPGHMIKCLPDYHWNQIYTSVNIKQQFRHDMLSMSRGSQGAGDVWGSPLGFTSGSFVVMGGSDGAWTNTGGNDNKRTLSNSYPLRYRPSADDRDISSPQINQEHLIVFDVTPSGNIPAGSGVTENTNSVLFTWGENASADRFLSYLTTAESGSGVVLRFDARDGTAQRTLIQCSVPYGYPSRVALHMKPANPYNVDSTSNPSNPIDLTLYVNGSAVNKVSYPSNAAAIWTNAATSSAVGTDWILAIGGRPVADAFATQISTIESGLGEIHLRNMSIWVGSFSRDDLNYIVTSGVRASNATGFSDSLVTTPVITADPDLAGYWRFTGESPQSGVRDLTLNANNLTNLVQRHTERVGGPGWSSSDNAAANLRLVPGPFKNSALPNIQGSGVTFAGNAPAANNHLPPFAISGVEFSSPNDGFSIGFWVALRAGSAANTNKVIASYGPVPNTTLSTSFVDASWAIMQDESSNIALFLSYDGRMPTDSTSTTTLLSKCVISRSTTFAPSETFEGFRQGAFEPGYPDSLQHIIFSYDKPNNIVKGYLNGELVSQIDVPSSGFHNPLSVDARMISFLVPQINTPWNFAGTFEDVDSILFETFYMTRPLTDSEARYVALYGFIEPSTSGVSGCIGGYMPTLAHASGLIGGYLPSLGQVSGLIGGYIDAVSGINGQIGGYIAGFNRASGILGGYIGGKEMTSGVIGGYIQTKGNASGCIGGYLQAGLRGSVQFDAGFRVKSFGVADFDAEITVSKSLGADYDAQITVFVADTPPQVSIIVPAQTVSGTFAPWSQYFVGQAIPNFGKSIAKASFYFSDFTAPTVVTQSGSNMFALAANHVFGQSGIYVVRFSVIDSDGMHNSATRVINLASGISPVVLTLSGVPDVGTAPLAVRFAQRVESSPVGVVVVSNLLNFDDGQTTIAINPLHEYGEPGIYRPIWVARDSRGFIFSDTLDVGVTS